jgi:hypothetical protein
MVLQEFVVRGREIRLTRNGWMAVGLALLASVAVGACGGSSKSSHTSGQARHQPTTRSTTRAATVPAASHPLVTVDGVQHGDYPQPYRVSIYDLRRENPYVVLDFGIVCGSRGCGTGSSFGLPLGGTEALNGLNEASGVTLVDPVSAKEYGVVYDSQQRPQASECRSPRSSTSRCIWRG